MRNGCRVQTSNTKSLLTSNTIRDAISRELYPPGTRSTGARDGREDGQRRLPSSGRRVASRGPAGFHVGHRRSTQRLCSRRVGRRDCRQHRPLATAARSGGGSCGSCGSCICACAWMRWVRPHEVKAAVFTTTTTTARSGATTAAVLPAAVWRSVLWRGARLAHGRLVLALACAAHGPPAVVRGVHLAEVGADPPRPHCDGRAHGALQA